MSRSVWQYQKRQPTPEPVEDDDDSTRRDDVKTCDDAKRVGASGSVVSRPLERWTSRMRANAVGALRECQKVVADDTSLPEDVRQSLWDMLEDLVADIRSN